jgi:hypothetical protein
MTITKTTTAAEAFASHIVRAQIAELLEVSQPTINRALSKGETRDAGILIGILRKLASEKWEKSLVYTRVP